MRKLKTINQIKKIFPIDTADQKTWPWIKCEVSSSSPNAKITWIKNPEFKYGHLIPGY